MPLTVAMLPDVLLVKVLQYVPLFDRLSHCSSLSRAFAAHVCEPASFAVDVVEIAKERWDRIDPLTQLQPLVLRCSGCSTFSLLAQLQRSTEWACRYLEATSVLSFTNRLTQPSCLLALPAVSYLRYLFLSGSAVETFASSALKWGRDGGVDALAHVQCVYFSSAAFSVQSAEPPLPWSALHLLLSLRSVSVVYLGHYSITQQQFAKLVGLRVRRLDFSTCRCVFVNSRNWPLCDTLESLLLPPFASWGDGRDPGASVLSTRRLVHTLTLKTATTIRHLSVSGVFDRASLHSLTQLNCLVSLDLTCYHMRDWSMLAALVGDEEDGQRYRRLRRLRHVRLSASRSLDSVLPTAAECDTYTQTLRTFMVTYAEQLETADVMAVPTTLDNSTLADPWLLSSMPRLKRLEVRGIQLESTAVYRKNWPHRLVVAPLTRLPQLHTLVVTDMELRDKPVMDVLTAAPRLQHVTFQRCALLTPVTLLALATYCPSLVSVCILSCERFELTGAAFHTAHSAYPTLFLPATADTQSQPPRPLRQCSLLPECVFGRLHTFVYELRREVDENGVENGAVTADEAGLAVLGGLFTHAPLQFLRVWWNKQADWLSFPHVLFPALLTLRSYAVRDQHELHQLMQPYVRNRTADTSEGRLAEHSLVLCDETRYGARVLSGEELECTFQHWKYFNDEFQSVEARQQFWNVVVEQLRSRQEEPEALQQEM